MHLLEFEEGIIVGDGPRGRQEQAVAQRHHVGLVAERDAPPALLPGQLEGEADNALRRRLA